MTHTTHTWSCVIRPEDCPSAQRDCARCGHAEHAGKCAGDPLDVRNSGVGGNPPQEPQGCLCGDPEFELLVADEGGGTLRLAVRQSRYHRSRFLQEAVVAHHIRGRAALADQVS